MAEPISIQQLKDASEDAISLADFINKPENTMIPRRLASDIHSLQYYLEYMKSFAQRSYETYDEMVANASNLSENVSVFVTNDLDTSKNGIYTYNGASFVKGEYQPENVAKEFVEAKLGGLEVFGGKVRVQDVSTPDGSTQEVKNTEFRNELDSLPFEGGVLADTFVTVTQSGTGMVAQNLREVLGESVSVKRFGAKGDGIADDSSAITKAITYAIANKIKLIFPAGTYLISTWTTVSALTLLHIEGDGRDITVIKGTGSDQQIMFAKLNNIRIKGITFEDMKSVAYYEADGVERWDIEGFNILRCGFRRVGFPIYQRGQKGLATLYTAKNVHILGNLIEDCGGGIVVTNNIIVYSAAHNTLRRIGEQYRFHKDVIGIGLGRDTDLTTDVSESQGTGIVTQNIFEDFVTTEPAGNKGVCNFFQIMGNNTIISQNIGTKLKNTNPAETDQEAVYWKGRKCLIESNSFTDAGGYESVIRIKGIASLKPDLSIIRHNFIEFKDQTVGRRVGININSGNCAVYGNNLKGCGTQGITIQNTQLNTNMISVYNNIIDDMNDRGAGSCYGIYVVGNIPNTYIKDNHISFGEITNSLAYGVVCEVTTIVGNPDIRNLHIEGNKCYSELGVSGTTGTFRAVRYLNPHSSVEMLKVTDNSAYVANSTRAVIGTSISITNTIKNLLFTGNSLITGTGVPTTGMDLVGTVINKTIANNIGYPTLDAAQKGVTAKRPTLPSLGDVYYDTTLLPSGKPITWNGNEWVDAMGDVV